MGAEAIGLVRCSHRSDRTGITYAWTRNTRTVASRDPRGFAALGILRVLVTTGRASKKEGRSAKPVYFDILQIEGAKPASSALAGKRITGRQVSAAR